MKMEFKVDGQEYVFDFKLTVKEAMFIKDKARVAPKDLWFALDRQDPEAVAAFVYVVKRSNGEPVKWDDMMKLDVLSFKARVIEPDEGDAWPDDSSELDPTSADGTIPEADTTVTA